MKDLVIIDDHTGEKIDYDIIGVWSDGRRYALAMDCIHSLNKIYIGEDGELHLSDWSIGPTAHHNDINKGVVHGTFDSWKLIKLPIEEIYERVREAS